MILHLLFDKLNSLSRNIATLKGEEIVLSKEGEQSISYSTSQLKINIIFVLLFIFLPEIADLLNFPLQIIPILEEVALVITVETIPNLAAFLLGFLILILR